MLVAAAVQVCGWALTGRSLDCDHGGPEFGDVCDLRGHAGSQARVRIRRRRSPRVDIRLRERGAQVDEVLRLDGGRAGGQRQIALLNEGMEAEKMAGRAYNSVQNEAGFPR